MLELDGVSVSYGKIRALVDVSLSVERGEHVAVLGPNGAGKSTLVRAIMGQEPVDEGQIVFEGEDVVGTRPWERSDRGIALVPEGGRLFPDATVDENLDVGAYLESDSEAVARRRERVFDLFPAIADRRNQRAGTLSGGEQQMVAIGRGVMTDPDLVLVDEITMGLMPTLVERAFSILTDLNDDGVTILQVEQNVMKTLSVVDRAYVLENGRVVASGSPSELKAADDIEQSYLGTGSGN